MKRFMYLSIGILCLMLSALVGFHMGSRTALAQIPGTLAAFNSVVTNNGLSAVHYALLSNGDVYFRQTGTNEGQSFGTVHFLGNFWDGSSPVPVEQKTWGGVKGKLK